MVLFLFYSSDFTEKLKNQSPPETCPRHNCRTSPRGLLATHNIFAKNDEFYFSIMSFGYIWVRKQDAHLTEIVLSMR